MADDEIAETTSPAPEPDAPLAPAAETGSAAKVIRASIHLVAKLVP